MKQYSYHELNPLIRLKELELIPAEMMERLVQAKDVQEVGELLKTTIYAEHVNEDFEDTFEESLSEEQAKLIKELVEIAPDPRIVWVYTMRFTYHNLKAVTKAELLHQDFDDLFIFDGFYTLDQIKSAVKTGVASGLPAEVMNSIQEVKEHFEESNNLQGVDIIFDRVYLRCMRSLGETLDSPELLQEIISFIDFSNIVMLGRGIRQKRSKNFISTVLSSQGSIPKEELLAVVDESFHRFTEFLLTTDYAEVVQPLIKDGEIDLTQLERIRDNYATDHFARAQVQAFGPLPLLALLNAKEVEIKNLRLIIVGKKVGLTEEQLRERMRDSYGT
ncbi:V-type ATPase subunit C [Enterococcus florum]|uniref:V-type ATPase subunit C n=1 Tax=Enterococcus florum TaxID=2480627 RepID=A0A4P5P7N7_9ENTE|nr:V-type ATPase subunit [Enterococcus florum]GCF92224.1 V-type ATPase subunit C [Enterococcus florum]